MEYFIIIIAITYLLAINIYGGVILSIQKKEYQNFTNTKPPIKDFRLFITGVLGGAPTIYLLMFIRKHKLKNMLFMIAFPIIIVLYGYAIFYLIKNGLIFN